MAGDGDRDLERRVHRLEERLDARDAEREKFRANWSDRDITDLRAMLNGWVASAAIKAFWGSITGKTVILGAGLLQVATFAMAAYTFLMTAHRP